MSNIGTELVKVNGASSNARTWQDFADLINSAWQRGVSFIFQTGEYLIEAHEVLDRREFEALVQLKLDFDASVARKLMRIAGNPILCAHVHKDKLPPCWSTLYELSKLEDDDLRAAIADGVVSPKMQRRDAIALRKTQTADSEDTGQDTASGAAVVDVPIESLFDHWTRLDKAERAVFLDQIGVDAILQNMSADFGRELRARVPPNTTKRRPSLNLIANSAQLRGDDSRH